MSFDLSSPAVMLPTLRRLCYDYRMKIDDLDRYRVRPGESADLSERETRAGHDDQKDDFKDHIKDLHDRLADLQELMYADGQHALLVVLQAMDAAGKDSTIRRVFGPLNPQGCRVTSFKAPSSTERSHDYLWRIHQAVPPRGIIGVFNRSHYEDVLIVRVKNLVPEEVWRRRYDHLRAFEQMLVDERIHVVKFYLHVSKDYQKERLQRRLDKPSKHWKFNVEDLAERKRWGKYQAAFEEAITRTSTDAAPWYVVPAERRWFRDVLIAEALVRRLESLKMKMPQPDFDPAKVEIE